MFLTQVVLSFLISASGNLLVNPDFQDGLTDWQRNPPTLQAESIGFEGRTVGKFVIPTTAEVGFPCLFQEFDCQPGEILSAGVDARGKNICDGVGVYVAFNFFDSTGHRLSFAQTPQINDINGWTRLDLKAVVPPNVVRTRIDLILNGHGEAFFDEVVVQRKPAQIIQPVTDTATLTVSEEVVCEAFNGFGAEDDGWFYNPINAAKGVTEADCQLRENRIRWMDPDWVRMFIWIKDWCPSGDWETFTFDSPNMLSHYRTLELYQSIGAKVNLAGAEWGMTDPYANPEKYAHAIGELYEYLIRKKGYTCISDWTLSNEPNGAFNNFGYSFEHFVRIHQLVREEFKRRELKIRLIGSDDAQDFNWFRKCVNHPAYDQSVDLYSSHRYFPSSDRLLIPLFFEDRLSALAAISSKKPFIVGEFGFQDHRSGVVANPLMDEYPYAVWTAELVIEGLNRGVAGFSIWCLHEMYYTGEEWIMNYGLWKYKDHNWKLRPVFYAWSNFSRLTERGEPVTKVISSHPLNIKGAKVGKTLFFVNPTDFPVRVRLQGITAVQVFIHTETDLQGDQTDYAAYQEVPLVDGQLTVPPMSFGYTWE